MKPSPDPIYLSHILQESFSPTPAPAFILWLLLALHFYLFFFNSAPLSSFNGSEFLLHSEQRGSGESRVEGWPSLWQKVIVWPPGTSGLGRHQAEWARTPGRGLLSLSLSHRRGLGAGERKRKEGCWNRCQKGHGPLRLAASSSHLSSGSSAKIGRVPCGVWIDNEITFAFIQKVSSPPYFLIFKIKPGNSERK